jgi:hypothetical protein
VTQRDRYILIVVGIVAALAAYWLLALAPKRDHLNKLDKDLASANQTYAQAQQEKTQFQQAQVQFPTLYASLGRLGKAVPAQQDVPSLLVQLNHAAAQANVDFRSVELKLEAADQLASPSSSATSSSSPPTGATGASGATGPSGTASSSASTTTSTGSTGAAPSALQPIPFELKFTGTFYKLEDLIHNVVHMVRERNKEVAISGRLVVIEGFSLTRHVVTILAATYMLPADQALFAGATPAGPSAATGASPQSASTGAAPSTPTASVTAP